MTTAKLAQIAKDIEIARCSGDWQAIPELARRYRKYNSSGLVFQQTILVEAALSQCAEESKQTLSDDLGALSWRARVEPHQVEPLLHQLESALQSAPETTDRTDREFAKIMIARCHYECGDFEKAVSVVETLEFKKDDVAAGYGVCLFLQARAIKAVCYEQAGNVDVAIQSYLGIVSLLNEPSDVKNESVFLDWAEESLYRAVMIFLQPRSSTVQQDLALDFVRAYQSVTVAQPIGWRIHKRMNVIRHSTKYLAALYAEGEYTDASGENQNSQESFVTEIMHLYTLYERMLYSDTHFPAMGKTNRLVIEFVNQLAAAIRLLDATPHSLRGFIDVLHRAAQRTFNSPSILRHLFLTLMRLGDFDEAKHALQSYLYLVGLSNKEWQDTQLLGEALVDDPIDGKSRPIPHVNGNALDHLVKESSGIHGAGQRSSFTSNHPAEKEPFLELIYVLITAVKLYSVHLGNGPSAVEVAEMARKKLENEALPTSEGPLLEAKVFRAAGVAYGLLARQTRDATLRATYHEKALDAFCESAELDPHSWETQYHLALQYAEVRDIQNALQSTARSLQANPDYIPSWHLLTLLLSCPTMNDLGRALSTCEIGLEECQLLSDTAPENTEQWISMQITQSLLLGRLYGSKTALEAQQVLFSQYGKLASLDLLQASSENEGGIVREESNKRSFYHHGMIVSGSLNNLSINETQLSTAERRRRGLSVSSTQNQSGYLPPPPPPPLNEMYIAASRSQGDMRAKAGMVTTSTDMAARGRSASTLNMPAAAAAAAATGRGDGSGLLTVPNNNDDSGTDTESIRTFSSRKTHHHGLHLFGSRSSSSRRSKRDLTVPDSVEVASISSTTGGGMRRGSQGSIRTLLQPIMTKTSRPTMLQRQRQLRQARILSNLWLLSATSYLELDDLDQAFKAIEEAENADRSGNPRVWCKFGQYFLAQNRMDEAMEAFEKGLSIHQHNVDNVVWLAKTHMECGHLETAEGLLESLTKGYGWDSPVAWLLLGNIYRQTDRTNRAKECLMYALDLESTTPIQPFSTLPCCI